MAQDNHTDLVAMAETTRPAARPLRLVTTSAPGTAIDYGEFGEWYDRMRTQMLDPALAVARASLEKALSEFLSDRDLTRIRSIDGRVKSKRRTWRKIQHPRYQDLVHTVDDILGPIDDLVGLRITCINLRDIDMIQTALDALSRVPGRGLWLDPASVRDYITDPKASGYRGWHVNLGIEVDDVPVACELQVRTLLQDSWGELTHEETYSKDGALPPLVDVLSTRMSDLLSILDDIAEDLRTELDRIDQETVVGSDDQAIDPADVLAGQAADAAAVLRGRWVSIDRPTDLSALAWGLQREFGAEISDDWFGHGSFKRFLRHAVPQGEITSGRKAYLLPMPSGHQPVVATPTSTDVSEDGLHTPDRRTAPGAAQQLHRIDPSFPLLPDSDWSALFEQLAESWRRVKPSDQTTGTVNRLTRSARDLSRAAGLTLSRRTLEYVTKAILGADEPPTIDRGGLGGQALAGAFAQQTLERMVELKILDESSSKAGARVERWITGRSHP